VAEAVTDRLFDQKSTPRCHQKKHLTAAGHA